MTQKITFQFIVSGDDANYRVIAYGHPMHNKRVTVKRHTPPALYWGDGKKKFNYTEAQYKKAFVDCAGCMGWARPTPIPWEIIHAYRAWQTENHERACAKYPDLELEPLQLLVGRYHYDNKIIIEFLEAKDE